MSITRKMLSAMGLESDKIEQIIEGHMETVTALNDKCDKEKAEVEKYKAEAEKVAELQKELEEARAEVETAKKSGAEYEKLKKEYEDFKTETERKAVRASKEAAYKEILRDAGIAEKYWKRILGYKHSDIDGVELDEDGNIKTAIEIMKEIREEFDPYINKTQATGVNTATPPANVGGGMTKEQIDAIEDTNERQRAMLEHHELYGI